jgi:hypothetical protein
MDFGSNNKDKNRRKYNKLSAITSKANWNSVWKISYKLLK